VGTNDVYRGVDSSESHGCVGDPVYARLLDWHTAGGDLSGRVFVWSFSLCCLDVV
jgi:hypothetical protein